ncbi:MAG: histidine kinase [Anaerolineae bacterium]
MVRTVLIVLVTFILAMLYHGLTAHSPLIMFAISIILSAWYGGARAGILATVILVPIMYYYFISPPISFLFETLPDVLTLPVLAGMGLLVSIVEAWRRTNTQAIELERRRLRVIVQSIPVGVIVVRAATQKLFIANDAARRILHLSNSDNVYLQEILQSPGIVAYDPHGKAYGKDTCPLTRALSTGETIYREVMEMRRTDPASLETTSTYLEATASPVRNERGEIVSGVMIFDDISMRRQNEDRLRLLHEMTMEHSRALTLEQVSHIALLKGQAAFGAVAGVVCLLNDDETELQPIDSIGYPNDLINRWASFSVSLNLPIPQSVREKTFAWMQADDRQQGRVDAHHLSWCGMPLIVDGEIIGAMGFSFKTVRPFTDDEREFALTLANHTAQSLQRAILTDRLKSGAAQEERQRLARDLHDAVSQSLFASSALAESIQRKIRTEPDTATRLASEVLMLNRAALAEMRTLLLELRPDAITRYKLPDLLRQLTDAAQARSGIKPAFDLTHDLALPMPVHIALYRIAQESINNVVKHSQAKTLSLLLKRDSNAVVLKVEDDGRGFEAENTADGIGMESMHERAASIGALLEIHSIPGKGTCVSVRWDESVNASAGVLN